MRILLRMSRLFHGPWTLYRKQEHSGMWMWFRLVCTDQGLSMSDAVAQAVADWLSRKDPEGKLRQEWAEGQ